MTAFNQATTKRTNVGRQLVNTGKVYGDKSDLAAGAVDPRLMLIIKASGTSGTGRCCGFR